jgi:uncharacterized coiled-coil protein SlyX
MDHWAYDAVNQLAAQGIFTGYPDGTFGGKRALTRYEFAVAIQRMLQDIQRKHDALQQRIAALEGKAPPTPAQPGQPTDLGPLEGRVRQLRSDVDTLRRLATEFQDTLATLGTDVDQLKKDMASLSDRMRRIEEEWKRMPKISGQARLAFISRTVDNPEDFDPAVDPATDIDGRPLTKDNILEDVLPIYDIDLGITAQIGDAAVARLLLNAGNYIGQRTAGGADGYLGGRISTVVPVGETSVFDVIPYYAYIETPISFGSYGASITVGKFGMQFTPYTLQMQDPDHYINNHLTDEGNFPVIGARVNFKLSALNVQAYAGRHRDNRYAPLTSTAGQGVVPQVGGNFLRLGQPLFVGNADTGGPPVEPVIDQSAGARITLKTPLQGELGGTYIEAAGSENRDTFRKLQVYGADLKFKLWILGFDGHYAETRWKDRLGNETSRQQSSNKQAWDGAVGVPIGKLALRGFYRKVGDNFDAPGNWFGIGRWRNPRGLEGYGGQANYPIGKGFGLDFEGAFYTLIGARDNEVTHLKGNVYFNLSRANQIQLGIENADFQGATGDSTVERYINIGWNYNMNERISFRALYQIINFESGAVDITPNADYDGAVAVTQFTVRF